MFYAVHLKGIIRFLVKLALAAGLLLFAVYGLSRLYPVKYMKEIQRFAAQYQLSRELVCGVIHAESRFDPNARSSKGASGLMQLTKTTADWGAEELGLEAYSYENIFEPALNIELGCWYLNRLLTQYQGDIRLTLAAYNGGSGNVAKWLEEPAYSKDGKTLDDIPFPETANYVERVEKRQKIYTYLIKLYDLMNKE